MIELGHDAEPGEPMLAYPEDAITQEVIDRVDNPLEHQPAEPEAIAETEGPQTTAGAGEGIADADGPPAWQTKALTDKRLQLAELDVAIADAQDHLKGLRKEHKKLTEDYRELLGQVNGNGGDGETTDAPPAEEIPAEEQPPDKPALEPGADVEPDSGPKGSGTDNLATDATPGQLPPGAVSAVTVKLARDVVAPPADNAGNSKHYGDEIYGQEGDTIPAWRDTDGDVFVAFEAIDGWQTHYLIPVEGNDQGDYLLAEVEERPMPGTSAESSGEAEPWRAVPVENLGLSAGICSILREHNQISTLGQLADFTADGAPLTMLRKIGEAKARAIEEATIAYWEGQGVAG